MFGTVEASAIWTLEGKKDFLVAFLTVHVSISATDAHPELMIPDPLCFSPSRVLFATFDFSKRIELECFVKKRNGLRLLDGYSVLIREKIGLAIWAVSGIRGKRTPVPLPC